MITKYEWQEDGKKFMNVTCDCGNEMIEYERHRSRTVFVCFDCFDWGKQTGKFFCDLE